MGAKLRPYLFYDSAVSICSTCLARVEAKILLKDDRVFLEKWCPEHGRERVLIADDAAYYRKAREVFIKAPEMPRRFNTEQLAELDDEALRGGELGGGDPLPAGDEGLCAFGGVGFSLGLGVFGRAGGTVGGGDGRV